jgi:hypothetical protein
LQILDALIVGLGKILARGQESGLQGEGMNDLCFVDIIDEDQLVYFKKAI